MLESPQSAFCPFCGGAPPAGNHNHNNRPSSSFNGVSCFFRSVNKQDWLDKLLCQTCAPSQPSPPPTPRPLQRGKKYRAQMFTQTTVALLTPWSRYRQHNATPSKRQPASCKPRDKTRSGVQRGKSGYRRLRGRRALSRRWEK